MRDPPSIRIVFFSPAWTADSANNNINKKPVSLRALSITSNNQAVTIEANGIRHPIRHSPSALQAA
ncbi:hypothetical protein JMJ77_0005233 [Colletotrichum scovillei]|uniref:Uncharacterized protein n=1 Tax=Colletotrichum scovillei TaxID=1209932 RepID=A0A9P7UM17_9PEZI|nr:hypothetical protein JMJ77_0005233 [Colletotrichum scovillei]KAG7076447.1 hypothetical protein JMJ76_0013712 [Colletotrichum scovillei]KAG7083530.1 hypothetical protein JMJ78_0008975 [Colletotrichum scovillei]